MHDPELFRAVARRMGALDPIGLLPGNRRLVERGLRIFAGLQDRGAVPAPGSPRREELLAAMAQAAIPQRSLMAGAAIG